MRLTTSSLGTCALLALISTAALADPGANVTPGSGADATGAPASGSPTAVDKPKDLLGNMVVVASAARALPRIGVVPDGKRP